MQNEKVQIRLELVKIRQHLEFDLRPRDFESHALSTYHQPQTGADIGTSRGGGGGGLGADFQKKNSRILSIFF